MSYFDSKIIFFYRRFTFWSVAYFFEKNVWHTYMSAWHRANYYTQWAKKLNSVKSRKWREIGTGSRIYACFRLVPKVVTLNDLEPRNGRYFVSCRKIGSFRSQLGLPTINLAAARPVALGAHYVKVVEDRPYCLQQKCSPKNLLSDISFMAVFAEVTENECIIERHLRDIDPLRDSLSLA